jgi:hypothetical protein
MWWKGRRNYGIYLEESNLLLSFVKIFIIILNDDSTTFKTTFLNTTTIMKKYFL